MSSETRTEAGSAQPAHEPERPAQSDAAGTRTSAAQAIVDELRTLHLWQFQPIRDLLVIALVVGVVYAGYALRTVTVPLLVALALAYLVEPVVGWLTRSRRLSRPAAVSLILGLLSLVVAAIVGIVAPIVIGQTLSFAQNLRAGRFDGTVARLLEVAPPEYRDEAKLWIERILHGGPAREEASTADAAETAAAAAGSGRSGAGADASRSPAPAPASNAVGRGTPASEPDARGIDEAPERASSAISEARPDAAAPASGSSGLVAAASTAVGAVGLDNPLFGFLGRGAGQVYDVALALVKLGLVLFLIPFYFYYFSVHWPTIVGFFADLVPDERRATTEALVREMDRAVAGFVRGRIVIALLMGILFAIGWQACGVPYGLALGFLTGVLSIVPYLGGIGLPIAIGLLVADQFALPEPERMAVWAMLVWPSAVFVAVQSIEGYLLTPVIAGKATNLDPVTIIVAILAGGSLAGVYGMLLAIPIAACGKIAARRLVLPRIRDWARGRAADPLPFDSE